ncbi:MAG: MotB [Phycisphaerae bacterium]|nr:MAG: MotB [Phycisphaerae bacterium]
MADHEHKEEHAESHAGGGHGGGGHGGGGGHEEGHEGAPEWLISFADNVALLMGFFVILLAMNMAKVTQGGLGGEAKMGGSESDAMMEFVISVREAFNNPIDLQSKRPDDQPVIRYILRRGTGKSDISEVSGTHNTVQSLQAGTMVNTTARITFDDQSTALSPAARDTLAEAAARLKDQRWIVEVRGHVSPFEVMHNPMRARELSFQRAMAAASALVDSGMRWDSLRVVACGDSQRLVPRSFDKAEDQKNQRVDLILTTDVIQDDPYARPRTQTPSTEPAKAASVTADRPL